MFQSGYLLFNVTPRFTGNDYKPDRRHYELKKKLTVTAIYNVTIIMSSSHECVYGMRSDVLQAIIDGRVLQYKHNSVTATGIKQQNQSKSEICFLEAWNVVHDLMSLKSL
jgi:hypothetical protein